MNTSEFVHYFWSFYGPNGLYPIDGLTLQDIHAGITLRGEQFEGDSFDREAIRDVILCAKNRLGGVFEIGIQRSSK